MVQRAQSPPRGSDFPFSSHRWAIWSSQGWIPCTRLCSWLGREWQVCCASEIWLSSSVTCRVSVGRLGRGIPCDQKHTERTSSLLRNLSSLQSTSPFAAKPKFNGFSHRGMEKSVFIGIWTNYLGKSKQANYTTQPSANDCQFRLWLLRPAHGPICMGQFTKPSFKGLIFTVIWGNIIVIITIVVIVIFATASLKMRRNLGLKDILKNTLPVGSHLARIATRYSSCIQPWFSPLQPCILNGSGNRAPRGRNLVLGGAKKSYLVSFSVFLLPLDSTVHIDEDSRRHILITVQMEVANSIKKSNTTLSE